MNYTVSTRKRSTTWSYQIFVDGDYYSSESGFKTKSEAKKAGDKAAIKIKTPTKSKDTFKAIAELYIADGYKEQSTIYTYENWLKNFKPIYDVEMLKLTYSDVSSIINDYYLTHKYNGSQSLMRFGKSIVNYAIDKLDYDMRNPFNKIDLKLKTENAKKEHQILTMDEMLTFFDLIKNPDIKFLSMCVGLAGMRISEARGLRYQSFIKDEISVTQQRQKIKGKITIKAQLKSDGGKRKIPLDPNLAAYYKSLPVAFNKNSLIIDKFYASQTLIAHYKTLGYNITPHSLRHAYATYCIQKGIDFKTLSELLGDTLQTVITTYAHVNTDMMDNAKKVLTNSVTN